MGGMQIRQSSMKGDRPECPLDHRHTVHKHGSYVRYCGLEGGTDDDRWNIPRFLCVLCRWTISVLPDNQLPYRSIDVGRLVLWLNREYLGRPEPPAASEKEKGCVRRALRCFVRHSPSLIKALGQIVKDIGASARSLWRSLSRLNDMSGMMRFLQEKLKPEKLADGGFVGFSLLGCYRCLAVQPLSGG
jgi:hypothetical protein